MRSFNSLRLSGLIVLLAAISLSACSGGRKPKPTDAEDATYSVGPVSAGVVTALRTDQSLNIPQTRTYNFKVCLKDVAVGAPLAIGQDFSISDGEGELATSTDQDGCVTWIETHDFNFYGDETFYRAERTITAKGPHRGSHLLPVGINPWKEGWGAVLDIRSQGAPNNIVSSTPIRFSTVFPSSAAQLKIYKFQISRQGTELATTGLHFPNRVQSETMVCLETLIENKPVQLKKFSAHLELLGGPEKFDITNFTPTTDENGCVFLQSYISFDYLAPKQRNIPVRVSISDLTDKGRPPLVVRDAYVDPWEMDSHFALDGHDQRVMPPELTEKNIQQCPTELKILKTQLQFEGHNYQEYEVSPLLDLTVAHSYTLQFEPFLQHMTLYRGCVAAEYLPPGKLKMTLVLATALLQKDPDPVKNYVTSVEQEVEVKAGMLTTDVVLKYPEILKAVSRNDVYVEFAPMEADSPLAPKTFVGQMPPMVKSGSLMDKEVPPSVSASKIRAYALDKMKQNTKATPDPLTVFREKFELDAPSDEDLAKFGVNRDDLELLMEHPDTSDRTLQKLCSYVYQNLTEQRRADGGSPIPDCLAHPRRSFRVVPKDFVVKLNSSKATKVNPVGTGGFTISYSIYDSAQQSTGHAKGNTFSYGVGADASLLKLGLGGKYAFSPNSDDSRGYSVSSGLSASAGVGKSWFDTEVTAADNNSGGSTVSSTENKSLTYEKVDFMVDAVVRRCVALSPKYNDDFMPIHICSKNTRSRKAVESYYSVVQNWSNPNSALADLHNEADMIYTMFIRGDSRFKRFLEALAENQNHMAIYRRVERLDDLINAPYEFQRGQYFPGVLDEVVDEQNDLVAPDYPIADMDKFHRLMVKLDGLVSRFENTPNLQMKKTLALEFRTFVEKGAENIRHKFKGENIKVNDILEPYFHNPIEEYYAAFMMKTAIDSSIYSWEDAWYHMPKPIADAMNDVATVENLGKLDVSKFGTGDGLTTEISRRKTLIARASINIENLYGTPFYRPLKRFYREIAVIPCDKLVQQTLYNRAWAGGEAPIALDRDPLCSDAEFESWTAIRP